MSLRKLLKIKHGLDSLDKKSHHLGLAIQQMRVDLHSFKLEMEREGEQPFVSNEVDQSHKVDFDLPPIFDIYNEEENEEEKKACCEESLEEIVVKVDGGEMLLLEEVSYTFYNEEGEQPRNVQVCPLIIHKAKEQGHALFPLFPPKFIPLGSTPFVPTPDLECSDPMPTPTKKLSPQNENPNPPITPPSPIPNTFPNTSPKSNQRPTHKPHKTQPKPCLDRTLARHARADRHDRATVCFPHFNPPITTPPHQKSQMFPKVGLREMDVMIKPSLFAGLILFQPNKF